MSTFKTQDGTEIHYKDWGSGKPVLFSPGWPLDADMWEYQMEYLSSRRYRTIPFGRRGFGRSAQPAILPISVLTAPSNTRPATRSLPCRAM